MFRDLVTNKRLPTSLAVSYHRNSYNKFRFDRECHMDWQGQKVAEQLMQIMLVVFAIAAFVTGYIAGSFELMMYVYAGGVVLTILTTIPNWPFFNRHPLKWLDPSEVEKHPKPQVTTSVSKKKPAKK
uniref:Signal peptidase complex subunit 1 n=3 Tax=Helianthus annuus TaxID=4232 RepID=A0A251U1L5_HELAN